MYARPDPKYALPVPFFHMPAPNPCCPYRWGKPLDLERTADAFNRGHLFSRMVALPVGWHHYKFIVDGAWQYDPLCAFEADEFGNINNVVEVRGAEAQELEVRGKMEGEEEEEGVTTPEEEEEDRLLDDKHHHHQQVLRRPRVVDPRHASEPTVPWTTMSGDQARRKWLHASRAMERQRLQRSDSIDVVIDALSSHERQQIKQGLQEYGLKTSGTESTPALWKSASLTTFASAEARAGTESLAEVACDDPLSPTQGDSCQAAAGSLNQKPFQCRANAPVENALIRAEERELQIQHDLSSAPACPLGTDFPSCAHPPSNFAHESHQSSLEAGDDSLAPLPVQRNLSRRGSYLAASFLGNGGAGLRLTRSRSLSDLDLMGGEYRCGTSSFLGQAGPPQGGGLPRPGRHRDLQATTLRALQKRQAACCAAVGSCQVKSSVRREGKMILATVGLPGRGKTHMARAIRRHLEWMGMRVGYFNSGEYRRKSVGTRKISSDFFDPTDAEAWQCRKDIATVVLRDVLSALKSDVDIAVLDAANCTQARRRWIQEKVRESGLYATVIFIESICTIPEIIASNVHQTILRSPEYRDLSDAEAMADFERKNQHYLSIYETLEEEEDVPFLKQVDAGQKIVSYRINGYIPGRLLLLLANIHTKPRPIWFSRHGESVFNSQGRIGGDSPLSARGILYAQKLEEFVHSVYRPDDPADRANPNLTVWTSTMLRTGMTVAGLNQSWEVIKWRCLDEIDAGMCDGLTYNEVAAQFPEEYRKRKEDKYNYRYPRGESYQDLFLRLEPLLFEMLRHTGPLLVVGHQAILRILYGYLTGKQPEECPDLPIPLHTVIQLTPQAYGCEEVWHTPMPGGEDLVGSANGHN